MSLHWITVLDENGVIKKKDDRYYCIGDIIQRISVLGYRKCIINKSEYLTDML